MKFLRIRDIIIPAVTLWLFVVSIALGWWVFLFLSLVPTYIWVERVWPRRRRDYLRQQIAFDHLFRNRDDGNNLS